MFNKFLILQVLLLFSIKIVAAPILPLKDFIYNNQKPKRAIHLWDIASLDKNKYAKLFSISTAPTVGEMRNKYFNGIILYVKNWQVGKILFTQYTGSNLDLLTGKMRSQPLTFQKQFYEKDNQNGESGINYWPVKNKNSMPMKIYTSDALDGVAGQSLKVDYDIASNVQLTEKPLIDEIRRVPNSDVFIGKMFYRVGNKPILFLWFALEEVK